MWSHLIRLAASASCAVMVSGCAETMIVGSNPPLSFTYSAGFGALKPTALSYEIAYGEDSYEVTGMYDVRFLDGSSTNGVPIAFSGKYGEPVKSYEITMRGKITSSPRPGQLGGGLSGEKKYYLEGIILRPENDEIRRMNLRALRLHVEENYRADHYFDTQAQ